MPRQITIVQLQFYLFLRQILTLLKYGSSSKQTKLQCSQNLCQKVEFSIPIILFISCYFQFIFISKIFAFSISFIIFISFLVYLFSHTFIGKFIQTPFMINLIEVLQFLMVEFSLMTLALETFAGIASGYLVSPLNTVVDKSVVLYANGKSPLWQAARNQMKKLISSPRIFLTTFEFKWMFFVYGMTYTASNLADHVNFSDNITHPIQKLSIVFLVNTTCSLIKDKAYIQHFGTSAAKPFPLKALAFLFTRDIIAMASAFTLPPIIGDYVSTKFNIDNKNAKLLSQLLCPLIIQIIATPIHLMGLDLYNRDNLSFKNRLDYIKNIYGQTLMIRMMRFLPAYGIGGIFNIQLREMLKKYRN